MPVFLFGQGIIVQSTNKKDFRLFGIYKQSPEISTAINKLKITIDENPDYSGKNMFVVIKITFYDLHFASLQLRRTETYSDDLFRWTTSLPDTGNKIILCFDFEENANECVFKDFKYREEGGNVQVPELVAEYIRDQILKKENNNQQEIVKKGINAVKKAFNKTFQQQMIYNTNPLLPQKKYYKGYTYFKFDWFNFKPIENQNKLPYDLEKLYQQGENSSYTALPVYSVQRLLDNKNTVYTFFNEQYLNVGETEVSTKGETIYYEEIPFPTNADPNNIFDPVKTEILSNIHTFKEIEYIQEPKKKDRTLKYSFNETENALSQLHKIKMETGTVYAQGEVDEYTGLSVFGKKFSMNQPTWCNKFARDVTINTYIKNNAILRNTGANAMNKDFNAQKDKFSEIKNKDKTIWASYINKGYLVFFSDEKHIEVGFPDNEHDLDYHERHPDDSRYSNTSTPNNPTRTLLTIGAGGTVGYKLAKSWATNPDYKVQSFIYLEYLKFEN